MNSEEAGTGSPSGDEAATASDGFETVTFAFPALADRHQQEKTEAITRTEIQRGDFTAGFLLGPARPHATRSTSRRRGSAKPSRAPFSWACEFPALTPNSDVVQNSSSSPIIQGIFSVFLLGFLFLCGTSIGGSPFATVDLWDSLTISGNFRGGRDPRHPEKHRLDIHVSVFQQTKIDILFGASRKSLSASCEQFRKRPQSKASLTRGKRRRHHTGTVPRSKPFWSGF